MLNDGRGESSAVLSRRQAMGAALALLATGAARPVLAQSFPTRAIQLIVPFAAGGGVDVVTRVVAEAAGDIIKQRFVIENRGGAGTVLGSQAVAKAEPDGYTLLAAPTTMVINPALRSNLPFDWKSDLVPVAMIATLPFVVSAGLKLPVKTMKELEALGKTRGDPITFGSGGANTVAHLAGEFFGLLSGAKVQHVAYRGEAPALTDTISGNIDVMFSTLAGASGQVKGGTLRALAVTTAKRTSLLPDVPTVAEQGYAGYDLSAWVALVAPKGTPAAVVQVLNAAVNAALARPAVAARLIEIGAEPAPGTPESLAAFMAKDAETWAGVIKAAGIKAE
ncbi:Bug family tripartite tricarboxylate transporter substrate binding protein [Bosea lathyri]|uniref:Tripartite-type tricarboxylate transporter, receptor component TctC n=1 Tax=Bosea lathyri TaxID=1036778 RepID=A0A1H5S7K5_9HYPH|nr:tripartite tricarboxylate transporter substrate-binding protein [Bosea lathyri]SEF46525.1 Tripartite-type tricarboxylate transporter, receptor component TctC [Bosea lathyri]